MVALRRTRQVCVDVREKCGHKRANPGGSAGGGRNAKQNKRMVAGFDRWRIMPLKNIENIRGFIVAYRRSKLWHCFIFSVGVTMRADSVGVCCDAKQPKCKCRTIDAFPARIVRALALREAAKSLTDRAFGETKRYNSYKASAHQKPVCTTHRTVDLVSER